MTNTFAAKPGSAAVLNYASSYPFNDAAYTNPSANLGSFKWHSGLYYLGANLVLTGNVDLKYQSSGWVAQGNGYAKVIAAHNRGYAPVIVGYLTINGIRVPINGSSLAYGTGTVSGSPSCISINVYADATNVVMRVDSVYQGYLANSTVIGFVLYVCNMGDNGGLVVPPYYSGVVFSPTQFKSGYFDPQTYQYFYRDPGGSITVYKDRSLDVDVGSWPASGSTFLLGCRQDINGYSITALRANAAHDSSPWNANWPGTPGFTPNVERLSATGIGNTGIVIKPGLITLGTGFNTNQNTLLISNYLAPVLNIPQFSASGGGIYRADQFVLGDCHPNANVLFGTYTIAGQTYSIGGTNFSKFFSNRMGPSSSYTVAGSGFNLPCAGQTFYLIASGGVVYCIVKSFMPRGITANLTASSISFKILAGTFDY